MVTGPAVLPLATHGNLIEVQILRPHPRSTESDSRERPNNLFVTSPPGGFDAGSNLRTTVE